MRKNQEHGTPQILFDKLNQKFHFDLDPCATSANAKCDRFFTKEDDGLQKKWYGTVFMNPPFADLSQWVKKASEHKGTVACLLPARVDTQWFHNYVIGKAKIIFIRGRLRYEGQEQPSPFYSLLVVYRRNIDLTCIGWDYREMPFPINQLRKM